MNKDERALQIVRDYIFAHLDKSDTIPPFDVYMVWKCKTLQNWKYLISSTLCDGMYYELTYNTSKKLSTVVGGHLSASCVWDGDKLKQIDSDYGDFVRSVAFTYSGKTCKG